MQSVGQKMINDMASQHQFQYLLEIKGWSDEWEVDQSFESIATAKRVGHEEFAFNYWRITNLYTAEVIFEYDPSAELERQASDDIERFASVDRWVSGRNQPYRQSRNQRIQQIQQNARRFRPVPVIELDIFAAEISKPTHNWLKKGF